MTTQTAADRTAPSTRVPMYTPEFAADPHAVYARMRREHGSLVPVLLDPDVPATLVIGYHTALTILHDQERFPADPRRWEEGRCLVFDDFYEHEAWNHTNEDRLVLIVDLWHPDLSAVEVELLSGLQRYAHAHAGRLGRYWSTNAAVRQAGAGA